jgi:hypothetical protein
MKSLFGLSLKMDYRQFDLNRLLELPPSNCLRKLKLWEGGEYTKSVPRDKGDTVKETFTDRHKWPNLVEFSMNCEELPPDPGTVLNITVSADPFFLLHFLSSQLFGSSFFSGTKPSEKQRNNESQ